MGVCSGFRLRAGGRNRLGGRTGKEVSDQVGTNGWSRLPIVLAVPFTTPAARSVPRAVPSPGQRGWLLVLPGSGEGVSTVSLGGGVTGGSTGRWGCRPADGPDWPGGLDWLGGAEPAPAWSGGEPLEEPGPVGGGVGLAAGGVGAGLGFGAASASGPWASSASSSLGAAFAVVARAGQRHPPLGLSPGRGTRYPRLPGAGRLPIAAGDLPGRTSGRHFLVSPSGRPTRQRLPAKRLDRRLAAVEAEAGALVARSTRYLGLSPQRWRSYIGRCRSGGRA